jgi:hypothetical protein
LTHTVTFFDSIGFIDPQLDGANEPAAGRRPGRPILFFAANIDIKGYQQTPDIE